jgi:uncharacterized protein YndB with AHSA1/START domain
MNPAQMAEVVEIKRTFAAPREKVFAAWTNAEMMARWFGRGRKEQPATQVAELDVRPGGKYRVEIFAADGTAYRMYGVYREVQPPEKLVFTWSSETEGFQDSVVSVDFRALGESGFTEVTLRHERLPEAVREDHRDGWTSCLGTLAELLQG